MTNLPGTLASLPLGQRFEFDLGESAVAYLQRNDEHHCCLQAFARQNGDCVLWIDIDLRTNEQTPRSMDTCFWQIEIDGHEATHRDLDDAAMSTNYELRIDGPARRLKLITR